MKNTKKIGVVLSGCGYLDGAEIHESVLTLLAIARHKAEAVCFAPDKEQSDVVNHLTGQPVKEKRNVLVEAARITRGQIRDIQQARASELDALILPGGYGAAKNLCDFAAQGDACQVDPGVAALVKEMHTLKKPIGAICIAPAVVARVLQGEKVQLTIGSDAETAGMIEKMGHRHIRCQVQDACADASKQVVSTPAYMLAQNILEAQEGIERLVEEIMKMLSREKM